MGRRPFVLILLACSCAAPSQSVVVGERAPLPPLHYSNGDTFALEHRGGFAGVLDPARPRDVSDGTLTGLLCGAPVEYDARWYDQTLSFSGYGDIPWPGRPRLGGPTGLLLGVSEPAPGRRLISGQFGGHVYADRTSPVVELDVSADRLGGRVDKQQFSLAAKGDWLVGHVRDDGGADAPFVIYGRSVLATMPPADESLTLVALLACSDSRVQYDYDDVRGFALEKLELPKGSIPEQDANESGEADEAVVAEPPDESRRSIDPVIAATTVHALADYKGRAVVVYLRKSASAEMRAIAGALADILRRAGLNVEQGVWRARSCEPPKYDLSVIANRPATPLEMAVAVRLTLTKLAVYVCQSANAAADKLGVLVLPPHR